MTKLDQPSAPQPPIRYERLAVSDQLLLWEFLYQALYVPPGESPFPRGILDSPAIAKYAADWGRDGDIGVLAIDPIACRPAGAAWLRRVHGYGFIDEHTPELTIAVLPAYRGAGVGATLIERLLAAAAPHYQAVSLSVSVGNPALRLYQRSGFVAVRNDGDALTMRRAL